MNNKIIYSIDYREFNAWEKLDYVANAKHSNSSRVVELERVYLCDRLDQVGEIAINRLIFTK